MDLVTFTQEILNRELNFFSQCNVLHVISTSEILKRISRQLQRSSGIIMEKDFFPLFDGLERIFGGLLVFLRHKK